MYNSYGCCTHLYVWDPAPPIVLIGGSFIRDTSCTTCIYVWDPAPPIVLIGGSFIRDTSCTHVSCVTLFGVAIDKMKKDAHRSQFILEKYKEMKYASAENRKKILSESEWSRHMTIT